MAQRVPGIIVRTVNATGIIVPPIYERYPVIIGMGDPYRIVTDYKLTRGVGSHEIIPTTTTVNSIVSVGDLPGISKYISGINYILVGNSIEWVGTAPTVGNDYYITYTDSRPASAFIPMLYFDESLIVADHGNKTRIDGSINDVTVGGSLSLNAGAHGVIISQVDSRTFADPENPTNTELENGFIAIVEQLKGITDYKLFLIPMSSGMLSSTTAADIFFAHAVLASQPENKQERTCVAAMPMGTTYQQFATFAQTYAHERMVVPAVPDGTCHTTGFTGSYDMRYWNCAVIGKQCSVGIGINISDEIVPNVTFDSNFTPPEANYLVQRGVSPGKIRGTVARNVMLITTDTTSALTEDLGVQDVKDYVKKYWREGLYPIYRNKPITKGLLAQIRGSSKGILDELIGESILSQWDEKSLSVTQDKTEPRNVLLSASVQPAFGVQWMDVTFTFVLSF